jgi:adenylyltransferase/sulfurtransferase
MALPEVGTAGQARIDAASVLVIGAGGLGVPVLQYLAAAGVGKLVVVDGDTVEASNLHRQPLYDIDDIGKPKAEVAAHRLRRLNPSITIEAVPEPANAANVDALVAAADVVVECTDNFRSKFLVNDAAVRAGKPAVFASVYQYEGQLQVYRPSPEVPCLRCLWPNAPKDGLVGNCAQAGVLGPVPGTLGALQAMETLKLILGLAEESPDSLLVLDLLTLTTRKMRAKRNPACTHEIDANAPAVAQDEMEVSFASLEAARSAGFELIDIREGWERDFDPPHLRIERHLALSDWLHGHASIEPGPRYLIVCAHGVRSLGLTERLRELGIPSVYSLRGGLSALSDGRAPPEA